MKHVPPRHPTQENKKVQEVSNNITKAITKLV